MPTFRMSYSPESDMSASPDAMEIDSPSYAQSFRKRTFDQIASQDEIHSEQASVNTERVVAKKELETKWKFVAIYRNLKSLFSRTFFRSPPAANTPEYRHVDAKRQRLCMPGEWPASPSPDSTAKKTKVPVTRRYNKSPLSSLVPIRFQNSANPAEKIIHNNTSSQVHTDHSSQTNARFESSPSSSSSNIDHSVTKQTSTDDSSKTNPLVASSPTSTKVNPTTPTHTSTESTGKTNPHGTSSHKSTQRPQTRGYLRRQAGKHDVITYMLGQIKRNREIFADILDEQERAEEEAKIRAKQAKASQVKASPPKMQSNMSRLWHTRLVRNESKMPRKVVKTAPAVQSTVPEKDVPEKNDPEDNVPQKDTNVTRKDVETARAPSAVPVKDTDLSQMDVEMAPVTTTLPAKETEMTQKDVTVPIPAAAATPTPEPSTVLPSRAVKSILSTRPGRGKRTRSAPPGERRVHFGGESSFCPGEIFPTGERQFVKGTRYDSQFPYGFEEYSEYRNSHDNAFGSSINSMASDVDTPCRSFAQRTDLTPSKPDASLDQPFTPTPLRELTTKFYDFHLHKYKSDRRKEVESFKSEEDRIRVESEKVAARKVELLVKGVDEKWSAEIDKVTSIKDHYRQVTPRLTRKDFGTLLPTYPNDGNGWLNDAVIGEYLTNVVTNINEKAGWKKNAERGPPAQVLASHLYTTYLNKGYQGVSRWASRAKVGGKKLLDCETLLLPINSTSHWTLLCVSGTRQTITYYDSLGGPGSKYTSWVLRYLSDELGADFVESEWTVVEAVAQRQQNALDCGVFVCLNGHALLDSREPARMFVGGEVAGLGRRWVAAVLLGLEW